MKRLLFLFGFVLLIACEQDMMELEALGSNTAIVGTWIEDKYQGDTLLLHRAGKLDMGKYGFTINEDGSFFENKNAGWCGTPPISYDSFEGTWEPVSDSLLDITVGYWGGMMTYQIRIVYLDAEELAIRYLYEDNRMETLQPD